MKNFILLFTLLSVAATGFGQKKLIAQSTYFYDEAGAIQNIDSIEYIYNSWEGSITSLKPSFQFSEGFFGYVYLPEIVHCNVQNEFSGSSQPPSLIGTLNNTLTNGKVTEANQQNTFRTLYNYASNGKISMKVYQIFNGSSWETFDSTSYTFDAFGNQVTSAVYSVFNGNTLNYTDTAVYQPNSSKLISYIDYYFDFQTSVLAPSSKVLATYAGNNLQNLKIYNSSGTGPWVYVFKLDYSYIGNQCTGFIGYEVTNGQPSTTPTAVGTFTFDAQNRFKEYELILDGEPLGKNTIQYDAQGFMTKDDYYTPDQNNGSLYLYESRSYFYQATASLDEEQKIDVTIYPNPTVNMVQIVSAEKLNSVTVTNSMGQVLISQMEMQVDLSHLPAGNYFITGQSDKGNFRKSIVKL